MKNLFLNKTIAAVLAAILGFGLLPPSLFAEAGQSGGSSGGSVQNIRGFDKSVFDYHFSRAGRELNPDRWLTQARRGIEMAVHAWEFFAAAFYDSPLDIEDAKKQLEAWSEDELEARFSQWLTGRFFGSAAETALSDFSVSLGEIQKRHTWHLDADGNIVYEEKTGDPSVIRPDESDFSRDLALWKNSAENQADTETAKFESALARSCSDLLFYIPDELRITLGQTAEESGGLMGEMLRREFENIAAREQRVFISRRTRDVWSLRKKSDDEAAKAITTQLIGEAEDICSRGVSALAARIEEAAAGTGDLVLMGGEWLEQYREQFERGLKAWEDAEERFFIRRIEWEQEAGEAFSSGEEAWAAAFKQFEQERARWELTAKELFASGEAMFKKASENLEKAIAQAKAEFEYNRAMRLEAGTTKAKALVDMYLLCGSSASTVKENIAFWLKQYSVWNFMNPSSPTFGAWLKNEFTRHWSSAAAVYQKKAAYTQDLSMLNKAKTEAEQEDDSSEKALLEAQYLDMDAAFREKHKILFQMQDIIAGRVDMSSQAAVAKEAQRIGILDTEKYNTLEEIKKSHDLYISYMAKASDARNRLAADFQELIGTGALKDILDPNASSDDFILDEYQIALIKAKTVALYWERRVSIAEAVAAYAEELSAGRMTEAEGIRAWEAAKAAYNESLAEYEAELQKLNGIGVDMRLTQEKLDRLALEMEEAEASLNKANLDYSVLIAANATKNGDSMLLEFNGYFRHLSDYYAKLRKTGDDAIYHSVQQYGMAWGNRQYAEAAEQMLNVLRNGNGNDMLSLAELRETTARIRVFREDDILPETAGEYGIDPADPRYAFLAELLRDREEPDNAALIVALCASVKSEMETEMAIRLAGIDLFADSNTGADWYAKASGQSFSNTQKTALAGSKLREKIIADLEAGYSLLVEKRLALELETLEWFISETDDPEADEPEARVRMLSRFCTVDKAEAAEVFEILIRLRDRIRGNQGYFTGNIGEDETIGWFVSGGSWFTGSEFFLASYFDNHRRNTGLLEVYDTFAVAASFTMTEAWRETVSGLQKLFAVYGMAMANSSLPDPKTVCANILGRGGDFAHNAARFIAEFDSQFTVVPAWLDAEITAWKNSIMEYIASNALLLGRAPADSVEKLKEKQELLKNRYQDLNEYYASLVYADSKTIAEMDRRYAQIKNDEEILNYQYFLINYFENKKSAAVMALTENSKHWRQYLASDYLQSENKDIASASSWKEGNMLDALEGATVGTARINSAFLLYLQGGFSGINGTSGQLQGQYLAEIEKYRRVLAQIDALQENLARQGRGYEYSRMTPGDLGVELERQYALLQLREKAFDASKDNYLAAAREYAAQGALYDDQYKRLKKSFDHTEQKRLEYETQDAIRRWASSAYLESPAEDAEHGRKKLANAHLVLSVLSDMYNGEDRRLYENSRYQELYSKLEQSFNRKMAITRTLDTLSASIAEEQVGNNDAFEHYQQMLYTLGNITHDYADYTSPANRGEWKLKDVITVKNGLLAFSRNGSMVLDGIDAYDAQLLQNYFNNGQTINGERHETAMFDSALRNLKQRMKEYFQDEGKFAQWSLAREFLLSSIIRNNDGLSFLKDAYTGIGELENGKPLGETEYKPDPFFSNKLYMTRNIVSDLSMITAWYNLSDQEKADLEFYVILALDGNCNDYSAGFSQFMAIEAYRNAYATVEDHYSLARKMVNQWWLVPANLVFKAMRDVNDSALGRIRPVREAAEEIFNKWKSGLVSNIESIESAAASYTLSCARLDVLEGKNGGSIGWYEINRSLANARGIKTADIAIIKSSWDQMTSRTGAAYGSVPSALAELLRWASAEENKNRQALENQWFADSQNRLQYEVAYNKTVGDFFAGKTDIQTVKNAANAAFGKEAAAWKNHLENRQYQVFRDLGLLYEYGSDYLGEFSELGGEYISLVSRVLDSGFDAELLARETAWNEQRRDIADKYRAWVNASGQLTENGRNDWADSTVKLEAAYKQWHTNFTEEYARVGNEWAEAYLAGLEEKEYWLSQASEAADNASSGAFLALIGVEAERMARVMDSREPLGMRNMIPEAEKILAELINTAGIKNAGNALAALNGMATLSPAAVRRGMGGASFWDARIVKAAASDLARQTNAELAGRETRRLAYTVHKEAAAAIAALAAKVDEANNDFRENMDTTFIFKGLWRKAGQYYIKDIIIGSTLFQPMITESKTVEGYRDYRMEPVELKINLNEDYLSSLDRFVITTLIKAAYLEIDKKTTEIFGDTADGAKQNNGDRSPAPGKFGFYIGYQPDTKPSNEMGSSRDSMFYDQGLGELGRLITEFTYWAVIDGKGMAERALAPWDRRIWDDRGSFFSAPSLRSAVNVIGAVALAAVSAAATPFTGGASLAGMIGVAALTVAISTSDEFTFGLLDLAFDYKTIDEVGFEYGKTVLTSAVSSVGGAAFNGISLINMASGPIGQIAVQTALTGVQTATTGLINSAISGVTYSRADGWGYSADAFKAGARGTGIGALSAMTGTLTSGTFKELNIGFDNAKVDGFNPLNKANLGKLNGLFGSLAGQGVEYAMGEDFTLNLLNASLFSGNKVNTGLLELHIGRGGSVNMNIGTGGADISPMSIIDSIKGAMVWNVNNRISRYTDANEFKERVTLRAQYGYGDDTQKGQLKEILDGKTILKVANDSEKGYDAETARTDGKRVVTINNYQSGMSVEDQMRLAIFLGHEAYRDGVASENNYLETRTATLAHTEMMIRMFEGGERFNLTEGLANDLIAYAAANAAGDMGIFNSYVDSAYDSSGDFFRLYKDSNGKVTKVLFDGNMRELTIVEADGSERTVSLQGGSVSGAIALASGSGMTGQQMNDLMYASGLDYDKENRKWFAREERGKYVPDVTVRTPEKENVGFFDSVKSSIVSFFKGLFQPKELPIDVQVDTQNYVTVPGGNSLDFYQKIMTKETAKEYSSEKKGYFSCNEYAQTMIKEHFGQEVFDKIFEGKSEDANAMFDSFKNNPNLERLDPFQLGIQGIQNLANSGTLVFMSYKNTKLNADGTPQSGHIAFIGNRNLKLYTVPAAPDYHNQNGTVLGSNQLVVVQGGTYTGTTAINFATNDWRIPIEREKKLKDSLYFYVVKGRKP